MPISISFQELKCKDKLQKKGVDVIYIYTVVIVFLLLFLYFNLIVFVAIIAIISYNEIYIHIFIKKNQKANEKSKTKLLTHNIQYKKISTIFTEPLNVKFVLYYFFLLRQTKHINAHTRINTDID